MTEAVKAAIDQIKASFDQVSVRDDGEGGAFVVVEGAELGELYKQETTWVGFRLTFQYPYADVYPHLVRGDLARKDGQGLGGGLSTGQTFEGRPAVQISRKSNHLNPAIDTALLKLLKVLKWLRGSK